MKIRNGFVSNSSSSSFMIDKTKLTKSQIEMINNHIEVAKENGYTVDDCDYPWNITETDSSISGEIYMDNFDMFYFLDVVVEVNMDDVEWSH